MCDKTLYKKEISNLMFYAQSAVTVMVISWRIKRRKKNRLAEDSLES